MRPNPLCVDAYKWTQAEQWKPGITAAESYLESRGGLLPYVMAFGLQATLLEDFAVAATHGDVEEAEALAASMGIPFPSADMHYMVDRWGGYFPVRIHALQEGSTVPTHTPMVVTETLDARLFYMGQFIETPLVRGWYAPTVATLSAGIKQLLTKYMRLSSDLPEPEQDARIRTMLNDFGARGATSRHSAELAGMAHLVNFQGTDNTEAVRAAMHYYDASPADLARTIVASEHSSTTSWGRQGEAAFADNMLARFGRKGGIFATVGDSYDFDNFVRHVWGDPARMEKLLESGCILVIRPDSGDPAESVVHTHGLIYETFGGTVNSRGKRVLNAALRCIQGDGIEFATVEGILQALVEAGYSTECLALGSGGGLVQKVNRDTFRMAQKLCAVFEHNAWNDYAPASGAWRAIRKETPGKQSKGGRLAVRPDPATGRGYVTHVLGDGETDRGLLLPTWEAGRLLHRTNFAEVRRKAAEDGVWWASK